MTLHPHILKKAQEEIDRVIGNDRFPTIADRANLPYLDALMKEVYRWHSAVPTGRFPFASYIRYLIAMGYQVFLM